MPEELGAHADAARAREDVLARRLQRSVQADRAFLATVRGATQVALQGRKRLDSIEAEIREALAHHRALALDTPAGARQFQRFLTAKSQDIHQVIADTVADSQARARSVRSLGGGYSVEDPASDGSSGRVKVGVPQGSVAQAADGSVRIKYDAGNPFAPGALTDAHGPFGDHRWSVNGDLVFTPGQGGVRVDGTRTDYPSLEIYQDLPNGTTRTVLIDPAQSGSSAGPGLNLPFHHEVGIGGKVFLPFEHGGSWNPRFEVRTSPPGTDFGPASSPPSVASASGSTGGVPA